MWHTVRTIQHHARFSTDINKFAVVVLELIDNVSAWLNANYNDDQCIFCAKCDEFPKLTQHFEYVLLAKTGIQQIFNAIVEHSDNRCASVLNLTISNISDYLLCISTALEQITNQEKFIEFTENYQIFWPNLIANSIRLIKTLDYLQHISFTNSCPTKIINPVLFALNDSLLQIKTTFDVFVPFTIEPNAENRTIENNVQCVVENLTAISVAWNIFCIELDKNTPDKLRPGMTKFVAAFNENLKTLYHHIPVLKVLMDIPFCGPTVQTDVTPCLMKTIERMIYRTERMLRSLWTHNCCDVHARCIYTLTKQLPQIKTVLDTLPDIYGFIEQFSNFLLFIAQTIEKLHFTMNIEILKQEDKHCLFAYINDEFRTLENSVVEIMTMHTTSKYPSWDVFTSSCRNDCDFLPDLYEDLVSMVRLCLLTLVNRLKGQSVLTVLSVCNGIQGIESSLKDTFQTIQEYMTRSGTLCQSCQSKVIVQAVEQIIVELDIAGRQMKTLVSTPNELLMQQTHEEVVALVNTYIGNTDVTIQQPQISVIAPRNQIDEICSEITCTNEDLTMLATRLAVKIDLPQLQYS
jgi:hypothetical protein